MSKAKTKVRIGLNPGQLEVMQSPARHIFYVAGLGTGKTFVDGLWALERAKVVGSIGLILANTVEQMRDAILPEMMAVWSLCGFELDQHYVFGRRPPDSWKVKPWNPSNNANIITWYWGSYMKVGSAQNYNAHRGAQFDWVVGDELRDWPRAAYKVIAGRLRGKAYKRRGLLSQFLSSTTPPDDPEVVTVYLKQEGAQLIRGITAQNRANLPVGYEAMMAGVLDTLSYRREILGELIANEGTVYYSYAEALYPDGSIVECPFDPHAPTWLTWDFNAGHKPMAVIAVQWIERMQRYVATAEWVKPYTGTEQMAQFIRGDFERWGFTGTLEIRGDYAGTHRHSSASLSDYEIIRQAFPKSRILYRPTLHIRDRVASLNALFLTQSGNRRLLIGKGLEALQKDLRSVQWNASGGLLDNKPELTHPSDALSYWAYNDHPVDFAKMTVNSRS